MVGGDPSAQRLCGMERAVMVLHGLIGVEI